MQLPQIKLPQIDLPFNIPLLMHPPIDHFIIAIPIVVLLLELVNLVLRKRAIGTTSFFLLVVTLVAAVAAYLTGSVDGKEAYPLLSDIAQSELKEHKLLGTYLLILSAVVLLFKILSSTIRKGIIKAIYMLLLILFVVGLLKQGKEGGELVYKHGVNVERVQDLESDLDDAKEEIEDLEESASSASAKKNEPSDAEKKTLIDGRPVIEGAASTTEDAGKSVQNAIEEKAAEIKESASDAVKSGIDMGTTEVKDKVESAVDAATSAVTH